MKRRSFYQALGISLIILFACRQNTIAQIQILPLHQFELKAFLQGYDVDLKWIAENEMNTRHFVVERSVDGVNYSNIGIKPVSGVLNMPTEYQFPDLVTSLLTNKVIYYRIKAEDNNNRYAYSNIVTVKLNKTSGVQVWPSPFASMVNITYNASTNSRIDISILDNLGKIINHNESHISRGLNQIAVSGLGRLSAGIYIIRITDMNTNEIYIQKLTK